MRLAGFAADQADYIRDRLCLDSDGDLAQVNIVKLAEETGEAANAYLAWRGLQRDAKLDGSDDQRLAVLGTEIADVIATAAVLAHAVGLDIDEIIDARTRELTERRQRWLDSRDGTAHTPT